MQMKGQKCTSASVTTIKMLKERASRGLQEILWIPQTDGTQKHGRKATTDNPDLCVIVMACCVEEKIVPTCRKLLPIMRK
jgi:hypothetical protein